VALPPGRPPRGGRLAAVDDEVAGTDEPAVAADDTDPEGDTEAGADAGDPLVVSDEPQAVTAAPSASAATRERVHRAVVDT
jgi:hypothetical protein